MQMRCLALLASTILLLSSVACQDTAHPSQDASEAGNRLIQTPPGSEESFTLGSAQLVPGTSVFRADLFVNGDAGFSSGKNGFETRNVLFIDHSDKAAHWLLPDSNRAIEQATDIGEPGSGPPGLAGGEKPTRTIATLYYVKAKREHWRDFPGELLLSDSTGRHTSVIADEVKDVQVATLLGGEIVIIYERSHHLVVQTFDPSSLAKKREQVIEIPALK